MSERLTVTVPGGAATRRADRVVADASGLSRTYVQRLIADGRLTVAGERVKGNTMLPAGSELELDIPERPATDIEPEAAIPLDVVYEDEDVLVIDKPAGLVTHPAPGRSSGTLVNALLARGGRAAYGAISGAERPGIVHRLDRDTSGLMVVARTARAYDALVDALGRHEVERHYRALVWGRLDAPRGVIDAPIGRSPARRTRMAVREGGREARTSYTVLGEFDDPAVSLLECRLETGRTHQIRVHLAAIGHAVVGDAPYKGNRASLPLARPFLHAAALSFRHPVSRDPLHFEEPLPDELAAVLERLQR
jgi:23S rRNA pseudouridine1911/1915/1917 synthase